MARKILLFYACCLAAKAGILPDNIGALKRTATQTLVPTADRAIWDEYGLKEAETAQYGDNVTVTAYRMQDSTGAAAAFEWQRPAKAQPSRIARLAAEGPGGVMFAQGNYLLSFQGYRPQPSEVELKNVDGSPLPALIDYLPTQDLVANSERYILGPASLEKFAPGIPPSTAGFHQGAEGQLAIFRGGLKLVIFNYPTPQIAMQRLEQFQKIQGAMVKRAGPMVAIVTPPLDPDGAERLLALVRYQPSITMSERVPTRRDNIGHLILTIFSLIGVLLGFCIVAGLAVGGVRAFLIRGKPDAMIALHLGDR